MDLGTIFGMVIGIGGIVLGHVYEGGHIGSLVQGTAALIVFGGTFGATILSNSREDIKNAWINLKGTLVKGNRDHIERVSMEIIDSVKIVRKKSVLELEKRLDGFSDPFMTEVFRLAVDGIEVGRLKEIVESRIELEEEKKLAAARVWNDAGGYAPTIGIIGAVLGLIHVMSNLTDTAQLGKGIAVAFVATIYGVGSANLFLIPLASKLKRRAEMDSNKKYMILEGALGMLRGYSPLVVEEKLKTYLDHIDA